MSKKNDFDGQLLKPKPALRKNPKAAKRCRGKKLVSKRAGCAKSAELSTEIYTFNDDAGEDLCVVELPASTVDEPCTSELDYSVEMTAADKLKSQIGKSTRRKKGARRDSGTSSEEERWLDAIESGKLEQVDDELKKIKDPKLMTARQRAMYERNIEKEPSPNGGSYGNVDALSFGPKEKVMSAEAIEKAQIKSQKRKQLADEKRETNKRKTMDRLLKKQEAKVTKMVKSRMVKVDTPVISYYESIDGTAFVAYPKNMEFPIKVQKTRPPPPITLCGICNEEKKRYNCSKTNVPLCSIECYKLNLERQQTNY